MWKGIVKKQIRKGASYEEDFVSKHKGKQDDFGIYVRSPKNVDIIKEEATLEWTGSIEVYSAGFGALSSSSNKLTLEIEYIKMGDDELEEKYITKEFTFTGNFEDDGKGNPSDVTVDMDFSDFNNPKITKVEVEYEGRFNE
tara:strand:- start:299 stop:721 length:423 start_codon:yes stop_codon:yes gene_type:complete